MRTNPVVATEPHNLPLQLLSETGIVGALLAAGSLAAAAEQLGDLGAARDLYVKAVDLQPLNWMAWYELGAFWVSVKNHEAAVAPLERAVELDPHGTLAPALLQQIRSR